MFTSKQLLSIANSFSIDPLFGTILERRSKDTWSLCVGKEVLNKNTGEFEYEGLNSERTESFILDTRFSSIKQAVTFYINWRKKRYFVFAKSKNDYRWNCFIYGENEKQVRDWWISSSIVKPEQKTRYGLWVLVGPDFKILDQYNRNDKSSEGVEFVDIIAKVSS